MFQKCIYLAIRRTTALDFRRADFNDFRDLLGRILWDMALKRKRGQEEMDI